MTLRVLGVPAFYLVELPLEFGALGLELVERSNPSLFENRGTVGELRLKALVVGANAEHCH